MRPKGFGKGVLAAIVILGVAAMAYACSTPVYRYALNNWPPSPYLVYYFPHGEPTDADREVEKFLRQSDDVPDDKAASVANVVFDTANPAKKETYMQIPKPVRKVWEEHQKEDKPLHIVMAPWGQILFTGRLDMPTAKAMLDSPVRQKIAKLLDDGNVAVMLIVAGSKAEQTRAAEQAVDEMAAQAASGGPDAKPAKDADGDEKTDAATAKVKFARLTIARDDAAEKWLLKPLLTAEEESAKGDSEPMLFPIFGRGRVIPPVVGKDITTDTLTEVAAFLAGDCSCQIKDQISGVDLLICWDWDATAQKLAQEGDDDNDSPDSLREVPGKKPNPAAAAKKPDAAAAAKPEKSDNPDEPAAKSAAAEKSTSTSSDPSPVKPALTKKGDPAIKAVDTGKRVVLQKIVPQAKPEPVEDNFYARQALLYGAGIGAAAIAVIAAGWFMIRRG